MKIKLANIGLWVITVLYLICYYISMVFAVPFVLSATFTSGFEEKIWNIYKKHPMWYNSKIKDILEKYFF